MTRPTRTRTTELAEQAWCRIQQLGKDPVTEITRAIHRSIDEHAAAALGIAHADARCRGMNRAILALSQGAAAPADVAIALHTSRQVAWSYLRRLKLAGLARSDRRGRYSLRVPA